MWPISLLSVVLLAIGLASASTARAGMQMYQGSWVAESFGNDLTGGTGEAALFSVYAMPQGILCNKYAPRCNFVSTPVSTKGLAFSALGNTCLPIAGYPFSNATRPAKYATPTSGGQPLPTTPRYRNAFFFTAGGAPKTTACAGTTTIGGSPAVTALTTQYIGKTPYRGVVMKGAPVTGSGSANITTTKSPPGFTIPAAPATPTQTPRPTKKGMRRTTIGEFSNIFPYLYSYTYARLYNDSGFFSAGGGPGNFSIPYQQGANTVAKAVVKAGPNKFGGVMRLLGKMTTKVCYFRNGGCSLGRNNWRYDAIGATAYVDKKGAVTGAHIATYTAMYYHTALMQTSVILASGSRFPWTTGTASITATGRGPHKTIHRRKGYDNRTSLGKGTIQLVSPILTRWLQPAVNFETGGVGIVRFRFAPEPQKWILLVAGLSMLSVLYRIRGR